MNSRLTTHPYLSLSNVGLLKQLRPEGGSYGFVTDWTSAGMARRRLGFVDEIAKDNEQANRPKW
jgi:hypothetical protein